MPRPTVTLLHGHTLNASMWDDLVRVLEPHFAVVRPDLPGYGDTLPLGEGNYTDFLEHFLNVQGVERTHLVGLSLGGNVALDFAHKYADRVDRIVLAATSLRGFPVPPDFVAALTFLREVAVSRGLEVARERWLAHPLFASTRERPEIFARLRAATATYSGWHWLQSLSPSTWIDPAVFDDLTGITAPTLILTGTRELPHHRDIAYHLAEHLPYNTLIERAGVGHMINFEDRSFFEQTTLTFLKGALLIPA